MAGRDYRLEVIPADRLGRPLFRCEICDEPITLADFAQLGLRLPDPDESAGEYRDAELVDGLSHLECEAKARSATG